MQTLYPWLQPYYQQITQAFLQQHGHHALLFKSEQGLGVESLIDNVAQWIMCQNPQGNLPCGHCHSCRLYLANTHPDVYYLDNEEGKDIGIESVRDVTEKINQYAQQGGNKIICIKQTERLTSAAANALLKTLEEPRANTYFLLQVSTSSAVLPTIYSRCQPWLIKLPAATDIENWLHIQTHADLKTIQLALKMNYQRPLWALKSLQQNELQQRTVFLRHFWRFYQRRSPLELLPYFEKEHCIHQLDWILCFLHDALKCKLGITENWFFEDLQPGIQQFSQKNSRISLLNAINILQKTRWELNHINGVNQELILVDGLTKLITEIFE